MRRFVGVVLVLLSIALGVRAINLRNNPVNVQAAPSTSPETTAPEAAFAQELVFTCPSGMATVVFKLTDGLLYEAYLQEKKLAGSEVWAANLTSQTWNNSCTKFAYVTGTPSLGFHVEVVDVPKELVTIYDPTDEVLLNDKTVDHIYSSNPRWEADEILTFEVEGFRAGATAVKLKARVDVETGTIRFEE